jgi:hypothetical protein
LNSSSKNFKSEIMVDRLSPNKAAGSEDEDAVNTGSATAAEPLLDSPVWVS